MAPTKWRLLTCFCLTYLTVVSPSRDIMTKLSTVFGRVLDECKDELKVGEHIMQDFQNYWQEDYQLLNKDFGCMIMCMAGKHKLLTPGGSGIHHDNAHEFAMKHGADDDTAKRLATILTECEKAAGETELCSRTLEVSKCFRTQIHELKWAPTIEQILEEVLTEV